MLCVVYWWIVWFVWVVARLLAPLFGAAPADPPGRSHRLSSGADFQPECQQLVLSSGNHQYRPTGRFAFSGVAGHLAYLASLVRVVGFDCSLIVVVRLDGSAA